MPLLPNSNPASFLPGEAIALYFEINSAPQAFAAGDIKEALVAEGATVVLQDLELLENQSTGSKVVIASRQDSRIVQMLSPAGGEPLPDLGREAFALRTTTDQNKLTYWVIGGDGNGAMYGGLQLAEYFNFNGWGSRYNENDSPFLRSRGIKFNIPLDLKSPTYFEGHHGTSHMLAIKDVWDWGFWTTWFDEMARHRYNALSLWSPHPFTAMLDMEEEYPGIAIQGVRGFDIAGNEVQVNAMTIGEKIEFWRKVMSYGRSRGFDLYFINWNIFLSSAEGKHGLTHLPENGKTMDYMKRCMIRFLETYPDLAGFGITVGERMIGLDKEQREEWAWKTFGVGMMEYAEAHPERQLTFIHRQHDGDIEPILKHFAPLNELPNVSLELSCKYSEAHVYSTVTPARWHRTGMTEGLEKSGLSAWLTVRNDDFHFLHWFEPQFVRDYIGGFPQPGKLVNGFYIGGDGWVHTREFVSRSPFYTDKGGLAVQRTWLMQMLWGRLSYNPSLTDDLFVRHLARRFPEVSGVDLFEAWTSASGALRLANEQVTGKWQFDNDFWIERWTGDTWHNGRNRHFTVEDTKEATPFAGSPLASLAETAAGDSGVQISAWRTIEQIETSSQRALNLLEQFHGVSCPELKLTLKDITAQALLGLYCADKFRAVILSLQQKTPEAREAMGRAYWHWAGYTAVMEELYRPVQMQRNKSFSNWDDDVDSVLSEYHKLGGTGLPGRPSIPF